MFDIYLNKAQTTFQMNQTVIRNVPHALFWSSNELASKSKEICTTCATWIKHSMHECRYLLEDKENGELFETVNIDVFEKYLTVLSTAIYIQATGIMEQSKFTLQWQAIKHAMFLNKVISEKENAGKVADKWHFE